MIDTDFTFMYNRLSMPKFFISQWLHVRKFTEAIDGLEADGVRIDNNAVIPIMDSILIEFSGQDTIDGVSAGSLVQGLKLLKKAVSDAEKDDQWFITKFGQIYDEVLKLRRNDDYVVDPIQMDRFLDLVQFFIRKSEEYGDKVEIERTEPKHEYGGVTATFVVFGVSGDEVREFCKVLKYCSAISIDAVEDGVSISCTVPGIFVRNQK